MAVGPLVALLLAGCGPDDQRYASVRRGPFLSTLRETGELQAVHYRIVTMPRFGWSYGRPKITELEREGTLVKKGDWVGQIETSGVARELGSKEADLAIAQADLNKLKVEQATEMAQLDAQLRSAESRLAMARIDVDRVRFESPARQRLKQLALLKAEMALDKLTSKRSATVTVQAEDLLIQKAKITRIRAAMEQAERTLESFTLRAPGDGIMEYLKDRRSGNKTAVGDQPWWGTPLIGLPDLSQMKVLTSVDETDIDKVKIGQKSVVRIDAYPQHTFEGNVISVSRISRRKEKDSNAKVFDVEVLLDGTHPILKPGMTVSCDLVVADLAEAMYVDNDAVRRDGNGFCMHVKRLFGTRRVPVTLGPRNTDWTVVVGDVDEGDRVLLGES
jgi:RND family efflux transporter MFP subunit